MLKFVTIIFAGLLLLMPSAYAENNNKEAKNMITKNKQIGNIDGFDLEMATIKISGQSYRISNDLVVLDKEGGLKSRRELKAGLNVKYTTVEEKTSDDDIVIAVSQIIIISEIQKEIGAH